MSSSMAFLIPRCRTIVKTLNPQTHKSITTFSFLSQQPQLSHQPEPEPAPVHPLPANPASGSPLYNEKWRNPNPYSSNQGVIIPAGASLSPHRETENLDFSALMNRFAGWMTEQRWSNIKQLFEYWIRALDKHGKPNKPDIAAFNHYLRANLMMGASPLDLLDIIGQMEDYRINPNTASYNLVLKSMQRSNEAVAAQKLLDRMIETGKESKESLPDEESFDLVVCMLLSTGEVDAAVKYVGLTLKSGYMLSMNAFTECVKVCVNKGRLDTLVSILERCKKMDQNKALCPPWNLCIYITEVAMKEDNGDLAFYALEFLAKWIAKGENTRPPVRLSVDEGIVVSALGTAGRTYNPKLLDGAWAILKRSLRQKKVPNPESYLAKIYAHASLGHLPKAFITLREFETAYGGSTKEAEEDLFSPFTSLNPLVIACSRKGFETLDSVYYQLENLSRADPPYKSVAALNCVVLGCANIWDVDRAYQTFNAMETDFGLTPDIHSYNALICAFVKLNKRDEAVKVFEHFVSLGVKPNAKTYSLLVDAHLVKRDAKSALFMINDMVVAGFEPSREMLKKVRRRCIREMDYESNDKVESFARDFKINMGAEKRQNTLFDLEFTSNYA